MSVHETPQTLRLPESRPAAQYVVEVEEAVLRGGILVALKGDVSVFVDFKRNAAANWH